MAPRAAQTFHVTDPETGLAVVYRAAGVHNGEIRELGDEVPDEVVAQVGDHVLEWGEGESRPEPDQDDEEFVITRAQFREAVEVKVSELVGDLKYSEADLEKAAAEAREQTLADVASLAPADGDEGAGSPAFDPSGEGVTAKAVADYLNGLDQADEKQKAEYDRVVAAEKAGQNRSTAIPS